MRLDRLKARMLLDECTGDDLWPVDLCRQKGIPEDWIDELADAYESGFKTDRETIYYQQQPVNQFHGLLDYHIAVRLAEFLGVRTDLILDRHGTRSATVFALKQAADEE
ncbi:MAG: hypothetical protein R3C28_20225 [Pirellulaceae bacterium]